MSQLLLNNLAAALKTGSQIQSKLPGSETVGNFVRKHSARAIHKFHVNIEELRYEIADMIWRTYGHDFTNGKFKFVSSSDTEEDYLERELVQSVGDVFNNPDLVNLTNIVFKNIKDSCVKLQSNKTVNVHIDEASSQNIIVTLSAASEDSNVDIFSRISNNILSNSFGNGKVRENLGDFLRDHVYILQEESSKSLISKIKTVKTTDRDILVGGHGASSINDTGNIQNALQILVINKLRANKAIPTGSEVIISKEELHQFDTELKTLLDSKDNVNALFSHLSAKGAIARVKKEVVHKGTTVTRKDFAYTPTQLKNYLRSLISFELEFTRLFNEKGELNLSIKNESKEIVTSADLEKDAEAIIVAIRPQGYGNNALMGGLARSMGDLLKEEYKGVLTALQGWINGDSTYKDLLPGVSPLSLKGSPDAKEIIADRLKEALMLGSITNPTIISKSKLGEGAKSGIKTVKKLFKATAPKGLQQKVPVPNVSKPRSPKGSFVSLINVVNIINMQLADKIRQNMGSPRLNYRTGRFAASAKLLTPTVDKDGAIRLPYTYMKYPYQTYEPGFARGNNQRDPKLLISKSIREIATSLVTSRLRIVRV